MKICLDTADVAEIREYAASGLVDGVTTNPSLAAKTGRDYVESLKEICAIVPGAVSGEVLATDYDGMMKEAAVLTKVAKNIAVKVPLTWDGLKACKTLSDAGTMVNVTLCFSPVQAWMAAKAGASFISPFIGRVDDAGEDGLGLIRDIRAVYDNYNFKTEIWPRSACNACARKSLLAGADVATMPPRCSSAAEPSLTDKGVGGLHRRRQEGGRDHQRDKRWPGGR